MPEHKHRHGVSRVGWRIASARAIVAETGANIGAIAKSATRMVTGKPLQAASVPVSFDLRQVNAFGPAQHQGSSERCIAYAIAGALEGRVAYRDTVALGLPPGLPIDLDEVAFVQDVGSSRSLEKHVSTAESKGISLQGGSLRIVPKFSFRRGIARMRQAIYEDGPLLSVMIVYSNFDNFTDILYEPQGSPAPDGHAVCIVGYEGAEGGAAGCWIVRNSYGTGWGGDNGYFKVRYDNKTLSLGNVCYSATQVKRG